MPDLAARAPSVPDMRRSPSPDVVASVAGRLRLLSGDEPEPGPTVDVDRPRDSAPGPAGGAAEPPAWEAGPGGTHRASPPGAVGGWRRSFELSRRGLMALAALAVLAVSVAVVAYWRARPTAMTIPPDPLAGATAVGVPHGSGSAGPPGAGPEASPSAAQIVVDVVGKVRHPGLVTLARGARVADAVRAAGGALPGTGTGLLNLAAPLVDGGQVVVGLPGAGVTGPAGSAGASRAGPVDVNQADAEQLQALPGIGPALAQRIVDFRAAHGRFRSLDDLLQVPGIGPSKLATLRPQATL